ncbi:F0F1 ATP synthase subunit A [Candidatus Gracilibacteria bacterium]|nr:F0F1 ATP synthase subunit A [Candidatus Gracilibacteria bacterium]MCF7856285.1 F0F1 ATP synthase subunit A [Candidatus Gracilibacteria bacterium]MCF7896236.1 F0F1 ATP synthase subunit A [Candidatus Gracilibacteria bacterium]
MHVSLTAEPLTHLGPLTVTNSLFTTWIVLAVISIFAVIFKLRLKKNPTGIQNLIEAAVEGFQGVVESVAENKILTRKFFAPIFTIFLFVLLNNWAGLIPGVGSIGFEHSEENKVIAAEELKIPENPLTEELDEAISEEVNSAHIVNLGEEDGISIFKSVENFTTTENHTETAEAGEHHGAKFTPIFRPGSADLSFTLALAIVAVLMVQFMGVRQLGGWGYFKRFLNFSNPIHFFVGILEILSEFSKMISFSFRLFGNVFAGEVLLTVIIALAPFVAPIPFYALEIFVGAVQALVFAMLTLVFFRMATTEAH